MDDLHLLEAYDERQDQEAFTQLVDLHGGWLYSAARRQLADEHLAEDVTQAVFLLLSQRAGKLRRYSYLSGWLLGALRYCVKKAMSREAAIKSREKEAASMRKEAVDEARWEEIAPELEEAVGKLGKSDRQVVLLRFYEQRPLAEVGKALGITEEASRMRVQRAVEKLRGMLAKKGISGTTAGLSAVLVGNVVQPMPEGLAAKTVAAVGSGGGNGVAAEIAKGAMKMMTMAKVKVAAVVVLVGAAVVGAGIAAQPTTRVSPAPATTLASKADAETQKLAEELADRLKAEMSKARRLSYTYRTQVGLPNAEDITAARAGKAAPGYATLAGEYTLDVATGKEYLQRISEPDDPARRDVTEIGGTAGQWTSVKSEAPGSARRWARVSSERPDVLGPQPRTAYGMIRDAALDEALRTAGDVEIVKETFEGEECYRVAMVTQTPVRVMVKERYVDASTIGLYRVWLSMGHGLLPVRCEVYAVDPSHMASPNDWTLAALLRPGCKPTTVVLQRDLQQVGGIWLPKRRIDYTFDAGSVRGVETTYDKLAVNEAATPKDAPPVPPEAMKGVVKDMVRGWAK